MFGFLKRIFGTVQDRTVKKYFSIVSEINAQEAKLEGLTDEALRAKTTEFRQRLNRGETLDQLLPEAFAVVKNACRRLLGTPVHVSGYDQKWDMVPFDVQLVGGIALHYGAIAEMQTGEGKTLTAVMPLYLNALTGKPVHLVTVNDYLARRDCQWTGEVLRWLGLSTGSLTNATPQHERTKTYQSDVVYGTASEFGFDYLRDNSMAFRKQEQVQRGYFFAIIDEADSILIDEARTPLIISGPAPVSRQMYDQLKSGVADLVRHQRDLCNRFAGDARKVIETYLQTNQNGIMEIKPGMRLENAEDAIHKLWLVGKGTPNNKALKRLKENPDVRAALDKRDLYFYAEQNKEARTMALAELFIIVDERASDFELTDKGIQAWADYSSGVGSLDDFTMLDISHEYLLIDEDDTIDDSEKVQRKLAIQEEDMRRKERAHNLRQLLRAQLLMERDVDYIIQEGKIIIIDENTGRPQPGRRFSDGLHQAIEAKEGLAIQRETQTYATITLQNYFRMYAKVSGMTGTASTEANEFKEIYKTDVLAIPTHRKCVRTDANDEVYMTEREKYNAILTQVKEVHERGRPILIGTESVDVSEKLSRILKQHGLEHTVLNAKQHEKEAEIVALAGKKGAITIATNMAGRGTDIKLESGVAEIGGLHVIGTTRHQSRRTDRQLRGRCARQGDPGSSIFYVSFEDALMRLFASPRLTSVLQKFRPPEGEPISASILNKSIETAQKRVEQRNYTIRKHTLEYDDVMNKQRQEIYGFRNKVLEVDEIEPLAIELLTGLCETAIDRFFRSRSEEGGWDGEGFRQWLLHHFPITFEEGLFEDEYLDTDQLEKLALDRIISAFSEKLARENNKTEGSGVRLAAKPAQEAVRSLILRKTDQLWQEHLLTMDHLRSDVNLRTVGQRDPLMEFKHEAFTLFSDFGRTLREEIAQALFRFEIVTRQPVDLQQLLAKLHLETTRSFAEDLEAPSSMESQAERNSSASESEKLQPVTVGDRTGRNEFCPCGSGKKYKKCCGANSDEES